MSETKSNFVYCCNVCKNEEPFRYDIHPTMLLRCDKCTRSRVHTLKDLGATETKSPLNYCCDTCNKKNNEKLVFKADYVSLMLACDGCKRHTMHSVHNPPAAEKEQVVDEVALPSNLSDEEVIKKYRILTGVSGPVPVVLPRNLESPTQILAAYRKRDREMTVERLEKEFADNISQAESDLRNEIRIIRSNSKEYMAEFNNLDSTKKYDHVVKQYNSMVNHFITMNPPTKAATEMKLTWKPKSTQDIFKDLYQN